MTCGFTQFDGAYVLGSLSAAERADFERHLPECTQCSRGVRELAGLPGLMGRVPVETIEARGEYEPAPSTLLPAVVAEVRQSRRRRTTVAAIVAAAVAIIALGTSGILLAGVGGDDAGPVATPTFSPSTAPARQMESLGSGWLTGWVALTEVPWGSRIDLDCSYAEATEVGWDYVMVVHTTDGRVEEVGSWHAVPGSDIHVTFATAVPADQVASLEVRAARGGSVLRLGY